MDEAEQSLRRLQDATTLFVTPTIVDLAIDQLRTGGGSCQGWSESPLLVFTNARRFESRSFVSPADYRPALGSIVRPFWRRDLTG